MENLEFGGKNLECGKNEKLGILEGPTWYISMSS